MDTDLHEHDEEASRCTAHPVSDNPSPALEMKAGSRGFRWIGWLLAPIAMFFVVAGIGYLREQHDERVEQERIRPVAQDLAERIGRIHLGIRWKKYCCCFPRRAGISTGTRVMSSFPG